MEEDNDEYFKFEGPKDVEASNVYKLTDPRQMSSDQSESIDLMPNSFSSGKQQVINIEVEEDNSEGFASDLEIQRLSYEENKRFSYRSNANDVEI